MFFVTCKFSRGLPVASCYYSYGILNKVDLQLKRIGKLLKTFERAFPEHVTGKSLGCIL
jgi:hypothetical protein